MRFYRKSDEELLATLMEERDAAILECTEQRVRALRAEDSVTRYGDHIRSLNERIRSLEETQQKYVASQQETVKTLLANTVESNAPVDWSAQREQVKIEPRAPRNPLQAARQRIISGAMKKQHPETKPN